MSDRNESIEEVQSQMILCGEIYGKTTTEAQFRIFQNCLKDYSPNEICTGFEFHFKDPKHGTFFPKPADIIRQIEKTQPAAIDSEQRAEMAWIDVMEVLEDHGDESWITDEQTKQAVKAMGGFSELMKKSYSELTWEKKSFLSLYVNIGKTMFAEQAAMIGSSSAGLISKQ